MLKKLAAPSLMILASMALTVMLWNGEGGGLGVAVAQENTTAVENRPMILDKPPIRKIYDPNPTFNGIAMDVERGEVFVTNDNRVGGRSVLIYRAEFDPAMSDRVMEPLRRISGNRTGLGAICGIAVSPKFREMFNVNNDGSDTMMVHPYEANGNMPPSRELNVPHGAWGLFMEEEHDELFVTVEHVNRVDVYRRTATGDDEPLRFLQGPQTMLADPHGLYVDPERNEIYVASHGHYRETKVGEAYQLQGEGRLARNRGSHVHPGIVEQLAPSTGKFIPAAITVYSRTAQGNVPPLGTIGGSRTQLNLPLGIHMDPVSNQIVVANSGDNSVLFFDRNANGNVAPVRILRGSATNLKGVSGVFVDPKRNEMWITSWDNHTITVFPRTVQGNVVPVRVVRSAPEGASATGFGNPGTLAFDPNRKQILVPN